MTNTTSISCNSSSKCKRIIWIDWAKVVLIYLMVVGHAHPDKNINTVIYAFHMPAFFIISGYLYREHDWKRTLKSFALPLVVFSLVNFCIIAFQQILKGTFTTADLAERIFVPYMGGILRDIDYFMLFPGCWFVFALMLGRFLMGDIPAFRWVRLHSKIAVVVLLIWLAIEPFILLSNPLVKYKFYRVFASLPFLLLGYEMKSHDLINRISLRIACLLVLVFFSLALVNGRCDILNYEFGLSYVVFFVNAIIGSLALFSICNYFTKNVVVEYLSVGTLFVLAFNFLLIQFVNGVVSHTPFAFMTNDVWVYPFFVGIFALALSYFPIRLLLKFCPAVLGK